MAAKILIVDDRPDNVKAFSAILTTYIKDLEIITADSGEDCIVKTREHLPEVVLLDVHMPGIDGFEACRIIKSTVGTRNISVLMVSALMTTGQHRAAGLDGGADGYLCKPFDSAELVAQVRALIRLKRYEDELRLHQDLLETELCDRTDRLRASESRRRQMEQDLLQAQKLESIGLLAGGIAHDFNNILMGVIGNLSLIKLDLPPEGPTFQALCDAEACAKRATQLTRQLLTFAKGGSPVLKTASLKHLLEATPRFLLSGAKTVCELSIAPDLFPVDIDTGQISQVIENIIINAVQAMPAGGMIRLTAENTEVDTESCVRHGTLKGREAVKIVITDEGGGIPDENLPRIFDPYFTTKSGGSGLGLATSYAIIRKHGGSIMAESIPGKGSAFTIYLPASGNPITDEAAVGEMPATGHERLLVMDDEPAILKVLAAALGKLGYRVETADSGHAALDAYREGMRTGARFDAVILDLTIPGGMGGEETLSQLKAMDPDVRAIVSSGYSSGMTMSVPARYGFRAAIAKPYSIHKLSQVLREVLGDAR